MAVLMPRRCRSVSIAGMPSNSGISLAAASLRFRMSLTMAGNCHMDTLSRAMISRADRPRSPSSSSARTGARSNRVIMSWNEARNHGSEVRQRAVEVEDGEAIVGSWEMAFSGSLAVAAKYAGFPVVQVSPQSCPPPSTVSVSPVTNFADGPARKTLASATSHGEPVRIIGFERG